MWLRNRGALPDSVRVSGPVLTLRTLRGRAFLDRLAAPKRLWRAVANLGLGGALVAMVGSFILILSSALSAIRTRPALRDPTAAELPHYPRRERLPPLSVAPEIVAGLAVAMVVHEGGACCAASSRDRHRVDGARLLHVPPRRLRRAERGGDPGGLPRRPCPDVRRRRHREHGPHGPRLRAAFRSGRRRHRAGAPPTPPAR